LSWADIPVLGSQLLGSFVAKADLSRWGFWGWMAKQQDTIYVVRENRRESSSQIREIAERLEAGGNVILFPEGTTSCGKQVLPFKSTLFAVISHVKADWIDIQPVTLAYTRINGLAVTRAKLPALAWYGDEGLGCHVLNFMRLGRVDAHVYFHEPLRVPSNACRKEVAQKCWREISSAYSRILNI
jgi:1-acyl-sn-glycerol-3-phosphate acyltransferase